MGKAFCPSKEAQCEARHNQVLPGGLQRPCVCCWLRYLECSLLRLSRPLTNGW